MDVLGNRDINSHYEQWDEKARLFNGTGVLEFVRSQELIERYLPPAPATILDVGGGPGAYAYWLTEKGYEVHLVDPVEKHIQQAKEVAREKGDHSLASVERGDARALSQGNDSVDSVLLLGPLYHLTEREDRMKALSEAYRVVRPGGYVFVAGINRFASLLDGIVEGYMHDPYFREIMYNDLSTGQHRNPRNQPGYFTTAYFHKPEELEREISEARFNVEAVLAVEGPVWLARNFEDRWTDVEKRDEFLDLIRKVESEPALLGVCPHFMVIGQKETE